MKRQLKTVSLETMVNKHIGKIGTTKRNAFENKLQVETELNIDTKRLQRLDDYLIYKEATAKSKAKQSDADALAKEVNKDWREKNSNRFIKKK